MPTHVHVKASPKQRKFYNIYAKERIQPFLKQEEAILPAKK